MKIKSIMPSVIILMAILFSVWRNADGAGSSGASVAYSSMIKGKKNADTTSPAASMPAEMLPSDAELQSSLSESLPEENVQLETQDEEEDEDEEEEEHAPVQAGPPPGFEVVCDGDVCELKPIEEAEGTPEYDSEETEVTYPAEVLANTEAVDTDDSDEVPVAIDKDEMSVSDEGGDDDEENVEANEDLKESEPLDEEAQRQAQAEAEAAAARELKEELDEYDGPYADELKGLVEQGWQLELALQALYDHRGNLTAATQTLEIQEREAIQVHFNQTVAKMVESGWDEDVARQALLTQWKKEEENALRAAGKLPPEEKTTDETTTSSPTPTEAQKPDAKKQPPKKAEDKAPKEAKREDVIFEVKEADIQKVILDSPVPVLLDVYADWCAPCRQLTPVLENAAIKAGGMFRLAKLNSDQNKAVSDMLQVKALPTVFGFYKGKMIDSFTGGLTGEEMQAFMIGVIMGKPANRTRTENDITPEQMEKLQFKLALSAGMASMGSLKRERLAMRVDQCLEALQEEIGDMVECKASVDCMRKVVQNCVDNTEVEKFKHLPTSNPAVMGRILAFENAIQALHLVGFRLTEDESEIALIHNNPAPLVIAEQRFAKWIALARKITDPVIEIPDDIHDRIQVSSSDDEEEMPIKRELADGKSRIAVHLIDGSVVRKIFPAATTTLGDLMKFVQASEPSLGSNGVQLLPQYPANTFDPEEPPLDSSLEDLGYSPGGSLLVHCTETLAGVSGSPSSAPGVKGFFRKRKDQKVEDSEYSEDESEYSSYDDEDYSSSEEDSDGYTTEEDSNDSESEDDTPSPPPQKSSFAARAAARRKQTNSASLFGADDGLIDKKDPRKQEYYGGSGTVFLYPSDSESESDAEGEGQDAHTEDDYSEDESEFSDSESDSDDAESEEEDDES